jgi:phosphoglycerol transferase
VLELWRADPRVPLVYMHRDSAQTGLLVNSIIDTGWMLRNPHLGAPFELEMYDFPLVDVFHFLAIRLVSFFIGDWALIVNLYYVLSFPAVAVSSLYALRGFGVSTPVGIVVSVLFAFLPYHLHPAQGMQHIFLSSYFAIPLVTTILLRVASGLPVFGREGASGGGRRIDGRTVATLAIAIVAGSTRIYYAFFACFFLLVAGGLAWVRGHRRAATSAVTLVAFVGLVSAAQLAPSALYWLRNGSNPGFGDRGPGESEWFGLKITQLLLPVDGHRLPALARLKESYSIDAPLVNENASATLGFVGGAGFLFLIARALSAAGRGRDDPLASLAALNLAAVLLGTIGGFGAVFAVIVAPQLRAWTRVSVYVAFFSLFAVALLLDEAKRRLSFRKGGRWFSVLLALLLLAGVADQTSEEFVPPYEENQRIFRSDAAFVQRIEAALEPGAMVFQLPYIPFPESSPVHDMPDYDHLRGYLHSRSLLWSYGSMKGRGADEWQRKVAARPPAEMLRTLALADFGGVYVNRWGYEDGAEALQQEITALVGSPVTVSRDAKLLFFDLTSFARELRARYSAAEWQEARTETLRQPLVFHWGVGCYDLEEGEGYQWHWCGRSGALTILNPGPGARRAKLEMLLATAHFEPAEILVEGEGVAERFEVNTLDKPVSLAVTVPHPKLVLRFRSDAERLRGPDPREVVFRVASFRGEEIR